MTPYRGKYRNLYTHLCGLADQEWRTSFSEVEAIVGCALPPSARRYSAWWSNNGHNHANSWGSAGWKTADVNMSAGTLVFRRERSLSVSRRTLEGILPARSFGPWPDALSLRREDFYREGN